MNMRAFRLLLLAVLASCTSSPAPSSSSVDAGVHRGAFMIPLFAGDMAIAPPGTQNPIVVKDSSAVARVSLDLTHGKVTAGGGGSDVPVVIGPLSGSETTVGFAGTNKAAATFALQADAASTVLTLKKVSSTSSSAIFSSPGLAAAATINTNDNGAAYFGSGALSTNYILFNGSSGNTYTVSSGGPHIFQDNSAITYATISGASGHGNITVGGAGTDGYTSIGTRVSGATLPTIYLMSNGVSMTTGNYALQGDGTNLTLNSVSGSGAILFDLGNTAIGKVASFVGSYDAIWLGTGGGFGSSNFAIANDAANNLLLNGPLSGSIAFTTGNAVSMLTLTGGTQNGVVMGANLATVGHFRRPAGWCDMSRNGANTANNTFACDDGSNNLSVGNGYSTLTFSATTQIIGVTASTIAWESGADMYLDEATLHYRNAGHTEYAAFTPGASATFLGDATNTTSLAIGTNKAGAVLKLQGDAAGTGILVSGTSLQLASGTAAYGGGTGVIGVTNATAAPTTNPSGGGIVYASGGALYWRGSNGTVTQIAPP